MVGDNILSFPQYYVSTTRHINGKPYSLVKMNVEHLVELDEVVL